MKKTLKSSVLLLLLLCPLILSAAQPSAPDASVVRDAIPAWNRQEAARTETIRRVSPAVAAIFPLSGEGGGSGVVISPDGFCLTNFHVVEPCGKAAKVGLNDGKIYEAVVVGIDPVGDVALIQLLGRTDFPCVPLGDSDTVRQGDSALVLGNPFVLADDFCPSASFGVVSGVHRYQYPSGTLLEYADCIQTDASVNPGNSGGPMFNLAGEVIGINGRCSFDKRGRVNVGVGYAISINQIKRFLPLLKAGRLCDHATLGAIAAGDSDGSPVIDSISLRSSIWDQGLRQGDAIVKFGNRRVFTVNELKNALGTYPKDWRVAVVWRQDESNRLDSALGGESAVQDGDSQKGKSSNDDPLKTAVIRLPGVHTETELREKFEPKKEPTLDLGTLPKDMPEKEKQKLKELFDKRVKAATPEWPESIQKICESRPGYVNYYYNRLAKQAVVDRWSKASSNAHAEEANHWEWTGKTADDQAALTIQASSAGLTLKLPEVEVKLRTVEDLTVPSDPADAGWLAPALFCWYTAISRSPEWVQSVCYAGQFPADETGVLFDCLEGSVGNAPVQWFFSPATGELVRVELLDSENPYRPWTVQLSDYENGKPGQIRVAHGPAEFLNASGSMPDAK